MLTNFIHFVGSTRESNVVVTYKITKYSNKLLDADVDEQIAQAFDEISEYAGIDFAIADEDPPEISLSFETGDHGDGFPFDGPGGVLAHAFKNAVHFDDDESWATTDEETYLLPVAINEIKHALGLDHIDW